jgi:type II secretory ATPase GspE/PulE/Tfp pilus assembly ATPase PilB-like protein
MSEQATPTTATGKTPATADTLLDALWHQVQRHHRAPEAHLGEALVARGLIDTSLLARALGAQAQSRPHRPLGEMLVDAGVLTAAQLQATLSDWLGVQVVDASVLLPEARALQRVPRAIAQRESVLPLMVRGDALVVALPDPWDKPLLDELRFLTDLRIVAVGARPGTLAPAVARAYRGSGAVGMPASGGTAAATGLALGNSLHDLATEFSGHAGEDARNDPTVVSESDNTLVRLVNRLIADAVAHQASDIHIETSEPPRPVRVRLRIDGNLVPWLELPAQARFALVARLKIMAELDIAEHRKPQDGKIDFAHHGGSAVELRMVTVPTSHGLEDVVLRLLSGLEPIPLEHIGLLDGNLTALRRVMKSTYGLILICGPTGCGKTTTLHSVMRELNTDARKIWTAEDPVEITQAGLRQVQVNPRIGWTFAAAMRTFLRADPDVIMIGEMRDEETARIAIEASLTGHLVMSTLHTNSAPESITRMLEIGLDPFMFSDSLLAILAQRLVRRLCTACRSSKPYDNAALRALAQQFLASAPGRTEGDPDTLIQDWRARHGADMGLIKQWQHVGCAKCEGTGYHGRLGLHELLVADEGLRELIRHHAAATDLQRAGLATGMTTLRQDGIEKVLAGHTDLAEVLAATNA